MSIAVSAPKQPVILLAEDDDAMREVLADRLTREGYRVVAVEDGFELRDYLDLCRPNGDVAEPDLVIADVRMPGESGLTALGRSQLLRAPVVLISAFAGPDVYSAASHMNVATILEKPFELDAMITVVRGLLKL